MFAFRKAAGGIGLFLLLVVPALALDLGDPAPPLQIKDWIKGQPVDLAAGKGKNIFVIELWSTTNAPSQQLIPTLNELQKKYKDKGLVVVGVAMREPRQDAAALKAFVDNKADQLDYVVGYDETGQTFRAYMQPFELGWIGVAFLVDKEGRLVWYTYEKDDLNTAVRELVEGKFDLAKRKQTLEAARVREENAKKATRVMQSYLAACAKSKTGEGAAQYLKELMPLVDKDPVLCNEVAWEIVSNNELQYHDYKVAAQLGKMANELTQYGNHAYLNTYAWALFSNGQKQEAIQMQRRAIEACDIEQTKSQYQLTLTKYEQ